MPLASLLLCVNDAKAGAISAAPPAALAAGYILRTFGPALSIGVNWFPNTFFRADTGGYVQNSDGSVTLDGIGSPGYGLCTAQHGVSPAWSGVAFAGGFYVEGIFKFAPSASPVFPWPAFWGTTIEVMAANAVVPAVQWVGQPTGYGRWAETDFFEADVAGSTVKYGGQLWAWYERVPQTPGLPTVHLQTAAAVPTGVNFNNFNKYGFLWIPATPAVPRSGTAKWFFNDVQVANTVHWDPYDASLAPPPVYNPGPTGRSDAGSALDQVHIALIFNTGMAVSPMTIQACSVWQASAASNLYGSATGAGAPAPPTIGTMSAGNTSAAVPFTAGSNGGSAITSFTATLSPPDVAPVSGASSPLAFTGLTNGTVYTATVTATNAIGTSSPSGVSNSVIPSAGTNLTLYANGTFDATFPVANDLSFSATRTSTGANACPGSTQSLQVVTNSTPNFGGGWQPGSLWRSIPPNGFDDSTYTQLQFSLYTPLPTHMYLGSHYSRSTGNDIGASTSLTQGSSIWSIPANTWVTCKAPLANLAMLGSHNFYKFALGVDTNTTFYVDNVTWIAGNLGWAFQGTGAPAAGWSDASVNATADYTWLPGTLNASLYSLNNPSVPAAQFTASCAGTTMTVTAVASGSINLGDTACWQGNLGGAASPTIVSGSGPYTLSTSQTVASQPWASAPAQSKMTGAKLTAAVLNGTLKLTNASFALSSYTTFTFGAIPTKSGFGYQVQFYNTSGAATGSAVTASSYTQHQFGISTGSFTVYNIPLTAFGTLPANIGGVSIKETSANATNVTYFSAIGFYS
jgi:hypothetical protein